MVELSDYGNESAAKTKAILFLIDQAARSAASSRFATEVDRVEAALPLARVVSAPTKKSSP